MVAVHKWVRWNRSRTVGCFLLKRLFMLPRHPRQYTPSSAPNPSLGPGVLDILVRPRTDAGSVNAFPILGFFSDAFALLRYPVDKLMIGCEAPCSHSRVTRRSAIRRFSSLISGFGYGLGEKEKEVRVLLPSPSPISTPARAYLLF
jgi:hypothetical protein